MHVHRLRGQFRLYDQTIDRMTSVLSAARTDDFMERLMPYLAEFPFIEAVYVLDGQGFMVTDTMLQPATEKRLEKLFRKAVKGDDLSLKEYFYLLMFSGLKHYVTESYTSLATGNLTRTISSHFIDRTGNLYVLCIDVRGDMTPSAAKGFERLQFGL